MTIYAQPLIQNVPVTMDHEKHSFLIYSGIAVLDYRDVNPDDPNDWTKDDLEFQIRQIATTDWDIHKHWSAVLTAWPSSFDIYDATAKLTDVGWAIDGTSVDMSLNGGVANLSISIAHKTMKCRIWRVGYQLTLAR